jgi:hypothetical protein
MINFLILQENKQVMHLTISWLTRDTQAYILSV